MGWYGRKLVGDRARKAEKLKVSEVVLADVAAVVGTSKRIMEAAATVLVGLISDCGLSLNMLKTKLMAAGTSHSEHLQS